MLQPWRILGRAIVMVTLIVMVDGGPNEVNIDQHQKSFKENYPSAIFLFSSLGSSFQYLLR